MRLRRWRDIHRSDRRGIAAGVVMVLLAVTAAVVSFHDEAAAAMLFLPVILLLFYVRWSHLRQIGRSTRYPRSGPRRGGGS